jgi:hypothetical protein
VSVDHVRTAKRGPEPVATADQVERVLDLAAAGVSLRGIARSVFDDPALYGRVRRLLRSTRPKTAEDRAADREIAELLAGLLDDDGAVVSVLGEPGPSG